MEESVAKIVTEIREDFQIPPYADDKIFGRYVSEGDAYFKQLVNDADFENDLEYRSLLKNYVYYAYHHIINEFLENYKSAILTWQIHMPAKEAEDA